MASPFRGLFKRFGGNQWGEQTGSLVAVENENATWHLIAKDMPLKKQTTVGLGSISTDWPLLFMRKIYEE